MTDPKIINALLEIEAEAVVLRNKAARLRLALEKEGGNLSSPPEKGKKVSLAVDRRNKNIIKKQLKNQNHAATS